jgi:hypothetical protein
VINSRATRWRLIRPAMPSPAAKAAPGASLPATAGTRGPSPTLAAAPRAEPCSMPPAGRSARSQSAPRHRPHQIVIGSDGEIQVRR